MPGVAQGAGWLQGRGALQLRQDLGRALNRQQSWPFAAPGHRRLGAGLQTGLPGAHRQLAQLHGSIAETAARRRPQPPPDRRTLATLQFIISPFEKQRPR